MVEVIIPPTMGAAIGFITSEPMPDSHRIGARAGEDGNNGHQLGTETLHGSSITASSISALL